MGWHWRRTSWDRFDHSWTVDDVVEKYKFDRHLVEKAYREYVDGGYGQPEHDVTSLDDLDEIDVY